MPSPPIPLTIPDPKYTFPEVSKRRAGFKLESKDVVNCIFFGRFEHEEEAFYKTVLDCDNKLKIVSFKSSGEEYLLGTLDYKDPKNPLYFSGDANDVGVPLDKYLPLTTDGKCGPIFPHSDFPHLISDRQSQADAYQS